MKRKEREHLKEDPFQVFIENALSFLKKYRTEIYIGLSGAIAVVIIVVLIIYFQSASISTDNELYAGALKIKDSESLTVDDKISQLAELEAKSTKGISSSISLLIASLYFENGNIEKAKEKLDAFEGSKHRLMNDQKEILEADVLDAMNKEKEAADLLNRLYLDKESVIAKDFVLLKLAKIQNRAGQTDTAITNLKKIGNEFPQSPYARDAREMLKKLEKN